MGKPLDSKIFQSKKLYFKAKQELIRKTDNRSKNFSKWLKIEYVVVWGILSL